VPVGRLRHEDRRLEPPTRRTVNEERQGRGRYFVNCNRVVFFEQPRVVCLLVGRTTGRARFIGRHPLIAAGSAGSSFPIATRFLTAVILILGAPAFGSLGRRAARGSLPSLDELADAHARRHEQRPTPQEENHRSEHAVTHGSGTPVCRNDDHQATFGIRACQLERIISRRVRSILCAWASGIRGALGLFSNLPQVLQMLNLQQPLS
jgi:hypothetical protein